MDFLDNFDRVLSADEIKMMNANKLAYIGDSIYEMYIRTYIINNYRLNAHEMNKKAVTFVKASAQSDIVNYLMDSLNEKERAVVMRGRNVKINSSPKNAELRDYRMATGLEALIGYLYLTSDIKRIEELIAKGIKYYEER